MSESPTVLIAYAKHNGNIKLQTYSDLSIVYNPSEISSIKTESDFYNNTISTEKNNPKDIYGFLPSNTDFAYDYSVQHIVEFFGHDPLINVMICDSLHINSEFTEYNYVHPNLLEDPTCPFFIRGSLLQNINFSDTSSMYSDILKGLVQNNIIFHIAEPLIVIAQESPI